jgi:hypothetical protein
MDSGGKVWASGAFCRGGGWRDKALGRSASASSGGAPLRPSVLSRRSSVERGNRGGSARRGRGGGAEARRGGGRGPTAAVELLGKRKVTGELSGWAEQASQVERLDGLISEGKMKTKIGSGLPG